MSAPWTEQDCPDDAPDGTCWHCGADKREPHVANCRSLIGTDAYDGAPVHGGVSDPAETSGGPPLPRYQPRDIASCPRCGTDLDDEGIAGFWCPGCREQIHPSEAITIDEGRAVDDGL